MVASTQECPAVNCSPEALDNDCLLEIIGAKDMPRIVSRIVLANRDKSGKITEIELLCQKCPLGIMARLATETTFESRVIDPEACAEGLGHALDENWTATSL